MTKITDSNRWFIYQIIDKIIYLLNYINLVEFFKYIAGRFAKNQRDKISYKIIAIDLFILLKFLILFAFFCLSNNIIITIAVFYLLIMNLHTYFYYHFWAEKAVCQKSDYVRIKRRFLNLIVSIGFTILCFSYLYYIPFNSSFLWAINQNVLLQAINFSIVNTFIGNSVVTTSNSIGLFLVNLQYIFSFIFLAILLSNTLNYNLKEEGNR